MRVQATVVFTFRAKGLADAGAVMDDLLAGARERDDGGIGGVEIVSPPGEHMVTLPSPAPAAGFGRSIPPAPPVTNGA
jgi:hypothetical protein